MRSAFKINVFSDRLSVVLALDFSFLVGIEERASLTPFILNGGTGEKDEG